MSTSSRRIVLGAAALLGLYTGIWAAFLPDAFYAAFPGFGLHWIDVEGAFDAHLIRDLGGMYLGLSAASIAAIAARTAGPSRVVGLAWSVFSVLHLGGHVLHPEGTMLDRVGTVVALVLSLALGVALLLPDRRRTDRRQAPVGTEAAR